MLPRAQSGGQLHFLRQRGGCPDSPGSIGRSAETPDSPQRAARGRYRHSVEVDETIQRARQSVAALLNANSADEVAFGMNATSFIRIVSLAIAEIMGARREIIVTDMDHEANIATWLVLEKRGAEIRWWKMREDGLLHTEDLEPLLSSHTRMVG